MKITICKAGNFCLDLPDFEYVDLVLMKCSASTSVSRVMFVLLKDVDFVLMVCSVSSHVWLLSSQCWHVWVLVSQLTRHRPEPRSDKFVSAGSMIRKKTGKHTELTLNHNPLQIPVDLTPCCCHRDNVSVVFATGMTSIMTLTIWHMP